MTRPETASQYLQLCVMVLVLRRHDSIHDWSRTFLHRMIITQQTFLRTIYYLQPNPCVPGLGERFTSIGQLSLPFPIYSAIVPSRWAQFLPSSFGRRAA